MEVSVDMEKPDIIKEVSQDNTSDDIPNGALHSSFVFGLHM